MKQSDRASILDAGSGLGRREGRQILVVEDDDDLRGVVADLLRDEDFTVIEAPHGQAALDYLLSTPTAPSLILLDLNMPVMSGREMIVALRGDPRLTAIPILVVTSEPPGAGPAAEGTVGRLQKPYAAGHLIKLVREHIAAAADADSADDLDGGGETVDLRRRPLVD
jgi:CheY-like chemotaxis protein